LKDQRVSRRAFLGGSAASAFALTIVPSSFVRAAPGDPAPSDKLQVACIGCGGKGSSDVGGISGETVIGLCDVDWNRARGSVKRNPKAKKFTDWRIMLPELEKDIDAVTVSTPDHHHALATMMALKMKKHVFCQKPLTHSIYEARMITEAAAKAGVVTQMGIQGNSNEGPRLLAEWIQAGWFGQVKKVVYWTNRPIWPQNKNRPDRPADPIPSGFDWDQWLGPAPMRPFHGNKTYHPFAWRGWWDFGSGALGDIACHAMDAAFSALKLGYPTSVSAVAGPMTDESPPNWSKINIQFPARGDMGPVEVEWNDGYEKKERPKDQAIPHPEGLEKDRGLRKSIGGQLIIGEKASAMAGVYCDGLRIFPETKMQDLSKNHKVEKTLPRVKGGAGGHMRQWIDACKANKPDDAKANFHKHAGPLTEMVLIGNMAIRTGKKVEWDAKNMKSTNVPEANQYVRREYRKGWTL